MADSVPAPQRPLPLRCPWLHKTTTSPGRSCRRPELAHPRLGPWNVCVVCSSHSTAGGGLRGVSASVLHTSPSGFLCFEVSFSDRLAPRCLD